MSEFTLFLLVYQGKRVYLQGFVYLFIHSNSYMKILITGAGGFVGCRVARFLALSHEVIALGSQVLDITDSEYVLSSILDHTPKAVIHLAAISDTGYCEQHPEDSRIVNLEGTLNVARAAAAAGAKLIYASSDQVYNGTKEIGALSENISLRPCSVYARHKWQAEQEVREILRGAVGLRFSWMYDIPTSPLRQNRNLLQRLIEAAQQGNNLAVSNCDYRGITNVWDVARRIEAAIGLPGGIYNFGSTNSLCAFDTWRVAARYLSAARHLPLGFDEHIVPCDTPRRNLAMSLSKIERFGLTFPTTSEGLKVSLLHGI